MLKVRMIDIKDNRDINRFIDFHYDLYRGTPNWTPPFRNDIRLMFDPVRHPYYEHSVAEFYVAERDGKIVGRIAAMENLPYNAYHKARSAQFYLFDSIDDQEVADSLFETSFNWARQRGLTRMVGAKGFSGFDGYGILVEGFEYHQMMNTMNYNFPYYANLFETAGFTKENEFVSCYLHVPTFELPEGFQTVAQKVVERGKFWVKTFSSKKEVMDWAPRIGKAYNDSFTNNWEYFPLSEREIDYIKENILSFAVPKLIKLVMHEDDVAGFLFGFPDVSFAMQKGNGKLSPLMMARLLWEMKHTKWISLNGLGMLPQYQGRGGNMLVYSEMLKTIKDNNFVHAELTQMADTAFRVRSDLVTIGVKPYKVHRIYARDI